MNAILSSRVCENPWPATAWCCCCGWSTSKWLLAIVYLISLPGNGGGFSCGPFISYRCATRHTWLRAAMHAWTANKAQHALDSVLLVVAIALMAINHRRNSITCYPTSCRLLLAWHLQSHTHTPNCPIMSVDRTQRPTNNANNFTFNYPSSEYDSLSSTSLVNSRWSETLGT